MTYLARDARGDIIALPGASPAAVASLEPAGDIANTPLSCPDTKCRQPLRLRKTKTDMRFEHDDRRNGCASDIGEKGDWHRWLLTEMLGRAYMQDPGRLSSVADVVVNGLAIQIAHEEIDTSPAYRIQRKARANGARGTVWLVRAADALRQAPGAWDSPGQPEHDLSLTAGYPGTRLSEWVGGIAVQATIEPDYVVMIGVVSGSRVRFVERIADSRDAKGRTLASVTQWSDPVDVETLDTVPLTRIDKESPLARVAYRNRRVRIGLYAPAPELCAEGIELGLDCYTGEWTSPHGGVFPGGRLIGDLTPEVRAWLEKGLGEQRPTSQQTGVLRKLIRDHWQKTPDGQIGYERLSVAALQYINRDDIVLTAGEGLADVIPYLSRWEVGKLIERHGWLLDYYDRLFAVAA